MRVRAIYDTLKKEGVKIHYAFLPIFQATYHETKVYCGSENFTFLDWRYPRKFLLKVKVKAVINKLCYFVCNKRLFWNQEVDDYFQPGTKREFDALVARLKPSVILIEYVFLSWLVRRTPLNIPVVIDTHDVFSNRNLRISVEGFSGNSISFTPKEELKGLKRAEKIIAIQSNESDFFRQTMSLPRPIYVVGHIVEPVQYEPPKVSINIGYIGSSNAANVFAMEWFFENVWSRISAVLPELRLFVAGSFCKKFDSAIPGVCYVGYVDSLAQYYSGCSFMINPMQSGTGLKIKTLESLAHGRAIVTTREAAEGLHDFYDSGLFIAKSADQFEKHIIHLASTPMACQNSCKAASYKATEYYQTHRKTLYETLGLSNAI